MAHQLMRPRWRCSCGAPWPCSPRRAELLDEYAEALGELRLLMSGYLTDGFTDLQEPSAPEPEALRRQLIGWLPPRGRR